MGCKHNHTIIGVGLFVGTGRASRCTQLWTGSRLSVSSHPKQPSTPFLPPPSCSPKASPSSLSPPMASVAARKKSMIGAPPTIDSPVANNTLLNKAASQSASLYQQCSTLRTRLMHLQGFSDWFTVAAQPDSSRRSTDPVTQLWDVFALGVPLCYLFNLLPSTSPIQVSTDVQNYDPSNERTRKHAIALFSMNVKQVSGCEGFTVRDLWDRNSTDGFVKVCTAITRFTSSSSSGSRS